MQSQLDGNKQRGKHTASFDLDSNESGNSNCDLEIAGTMLLLDDWERLMG